jgi:peptidyl-Lys metalloendopeptidase
MLMKIGNRNLMVALSMFAAIDCASADSPACIGAELATAQAALERAKGALTKSIANLENGDSTTATKATTWLGVHNSGEAQQVKNVLSRALALAANPSFICDNVTYKNLGDVYAHVLPSDPFIIKLGAFFWPAPDTGFDSKPGTIIHEMTHFSSVGATADLASDTNSSKDLAHSDPAGARRNANNYEYFVESVAFGLDD